MNLLNIRTDFVAIQVCFTTIFLFIAKAEEHETKIDPSLEYV